MAYGLTVDGFVTKTLPLIREGINTDLAEEYGNSIDTSDYAVEGQVGGILSEIAALIWELAEAVYASQDPDKATGQALEALCALTGTFRLQASYSSVTMTLTGVPTTPVSVGSLIATKSTGRQFETLGALAAVITALTAWAPSTPYALGVRRTNAGNAYIVRTAGVSAGSGGPTTEDDDIIDGSVHWRYMGDGTGAVDVAARASETGPIVAVAGDLTEIKSPQGGWNGAINLLDATRGNDRMTDESLRILRELELAQPGTGTINALRAAVLNVVGVSSATVFTNTADVVVDGMPPHSVEVLVRGGVDQSIFNAIGNNVAAGIKSHGTEDGYFVDSEGTAQDVEFSRPEELAIYVDVTVEYDPARYPANGDDLVKAAIVEWGDVQPTGMDARATLIGAQSFFANIGVLNIVETLIGLAPSPSTSSTIEVSKRQLAVYDTSRINVTSAAVVP